MNTLTHFRNLEKDDLRGDCSEGLSFSKHAKGEKITILETGIEYAIADQIRFHDRNSEFYKIFSFYGVTRSNINKFDQRLRKFGDTAVIIIDGNELIHRIIRAAKTRNFGYRIESVSYVNKEKHNGEMGPFRKYSDLNYQSEFRIAFSMNQKGPLEDFYIGDIRDISVMYDSDYAIETVKYVIKKNRLRES